MAINQGPSFITQATRPETTTKQHSLPFERDVKRLPSTTPDRSPAVERIDDVVITMRDGIHLSGDVYLPVNRSGPLPTVVTRLPYGKREDYCQMPVYGEFWACKGYAFLVQDVRGKFDSEGDFEPTPSRSTTVMTPPNGPPPSPGAMAASAFMANPITASRPSPRRSACIRPSSASRRVTSPLTVSAAPSATALCSSTPWATGRFP